VNSIILLTAARVLRPVLFLFSLFLLFRGHHEPGGGFAGGLLAAAAFSLGAMRRDIQEVEQQKRRIEPHMLIGAGLLLAMGSGLASMFIGRQFLTGLWAGFFSNVLLFDIGVYLTVMGVVLMTVTTLAEE
jgi:multicomponent Na+:H+ antiporter subunit B